MGKYEKISEKINQLDELYMKAKEYDKIIKFGKEQFKCSFCGKPQNKAERLIWNNHNNVGICEHCVALCDSMCQDGLKERYNEIKKEYV